jgi:hypothetical protein
MMAEIDIRIDEATMDDRKRGDIATAREKEIIADLRAFEASLAKAEDEVWQPHWSREDPTRDRLLRIGLSEGVVENMVVLLECICRVILNKPVPAKIRKELDDMGEGGSSALSQLADLVADAGKRRR